MATCHVIALAMCVMVTWALRAEVLSPVRTSGKEAGLIIVPGAFISGTAYRPLGEAIQQRSMLRLWVGLLDGFLLNTPNPLQLDAAIQKCKKAFADHGMTTSDIFLAGHSLGGVFVGDYGKKHSSELAGVLLFGSYLTQGNTVENYPLPVLTLVGELDGLTRVTRILPPFQRVNAMMAMGERYAAYRTPVVLVPGLNHGQFASGPMPPEVRNQDLAPELDNVTAYQAIANVTEHFMVVSLGEPVEVQDAYKQELLLSFSSTGDFFQPLKDLMFLDENDAGVSEWSIRAQNILAGSPTNFSLQLHVNNTEETDTSKFWQETPSLHRSASLVTVKTVTHVQFPFNPLDVSTVPSSPSQLAVKMMRRDFIFPPGHRSLANTTCKDVNQAAYELALQTASKVALNRFHDRKGKVMVMKEDDVMAADLEWEASSISMEADATSLSVTSTVFLTSVDASGPMAGMRYCTLLSPYRALEWIYVDSLRKDHSSLL